MQISLHKFDASSPITHIGTLALKFNFWGLCLCLRLADAISILQCILDLIINSTPRTSGIMAIMAA